MTQLLTNNTRGRLFFSLEKKETTLFISIELEIDLTILMGLLKN